MICEQWLPPATGDLSLADQVARCGTAVSGTKRTRSRVSPRSGVQGTPEVVGARSKRRD